MWIRQSWKVCILFFVWLNALFFCFVILVYKENLSIHFLLEDQVILGFISSKIVVIFILEEAMNDLSREVRSSWPNW